MSDQRLIFSSETSNLRWFLLSSEAYGIIHSIESLYNNEKYNAPFEPKKYTIKPQLFRDQESQLNHKNEKKFSDFFKEYNDHYIIDDYIKIIRKEIIKKEENSNSTQKLETIPLLERNKLNHKMTNENLSNSQKSPIICNLMEKTDSVLLKQLKHEWHHPQKAVFKPFLEVKFFFTLNNLFLQINQIFK